MNAEGGDQVPSERRASRTPDPAVPAKYIPARKAVKIAIPAASERTWGGILDLAGGVVSRDLELQCVMG